MHVGHGIARLRTYIHVTLYIHVARLHVLVGHSARLVAAWARDKEAASAHCNRRDRQASGKFAYVVSVLVSAEGSRERSCTRRRAFAGMS